MDAIQAAALATDLNTALGGLTATYLYDIFPYWDNTYTKYYNVVLYPAKYSVEFAAATDSELLAFARVSAITQTKNPADFVAEFDLQGAQDAELAAYLGL
jgi:hypothetical protein